MCDSSLNAENAYHADNADQHIPVSSACFDTLSVMLSSTQASKCANIEPDHRGRH